jgi:hypothetical protein
VVAATVTAQVKVTIVKGNYMSPALICSIKILQAMVLQFQFHLFAGQCSGHKQMKLEVLNSRKVVSFLCSNLLLLKMYPSIAFEAAVVNLDRLEAGPSFDVSHPCNSDHAKCVCTYYVTFLYSECQVWHEIDELWHQIDEHSLSMRGCQVCQVP